MLSRTAVFLLSTAAVTLVGAEHFDKERESEMKDYKRVFFKKPEMHVNPFFGYNKYKVVKYTPPLLPPAPVVAQPVVDQYADEYQYQGQVAYSPPTNAYIPPPSQYQEPIYARTNYEMGQPSYKRYAVDEAPTGQKGFENIATFLKSSRV